MTEFIAVLVIFFILFLGIYLHNKSVSSSKTEKIDVNIPRKSDTIYNSLGNYEQQLSLLSKFPKNSTTDIGKYLFISLRLSDIPCDNSKIIEFAWLLVDKDGLQVGGGNNIVKQKCKIAKDIGINIGISTEKMQKEGLPPTDVYTDFVECLTNAEFIISYDLENKLNFLISDMCKNGFNIDINDKKQVCLKSIATLYLRNQEEDGFDDGVDILNVSLQRLFFHLYFGLTALKISNANNSLSDVLLSYRSYMKIKEIYKLEDEKKDVSPSVCNTHYKPVSCDFVAIDFETATSKRYSACQLGIIVMKNGEIIEQKSYLIQPPDNEYNKINTTIHGISSLSTINAKTFEQLWPEVKNYINNVLLIAHNADFDIDVLMKTCEYYNINDLNIKDHRCTYRLTDLPLIEAAQAFSITVSGHHDALQDALMCAHIYNCIERGQHPNFSLIKVMKGGKKESDQAIIEHFTNKSSDMFDGKGVLVTGVFGSFNRDDLISILTNKGAILKSGVSSKVNYVIMGMDAGPVKIKKIAELQDKGIAIKVIDEAELLKILNE